MKNNLYPDFQPTLDNCDREPIHRPASIQGFGALLAFYRNTKRPVAFSNNFRKIAVWEMEGFWDSDIEEYLPQEVKDVLDNHFSGASWSEINPVEMTLGDQAYQLIGHDYDEFVILEFEEKNEEVKEPEELHRVLFSLSSVLKQCDSITELAETAADFLKKLTCYDRVMVYKFDKDWHGEVIGEAKEEHLEPFLGLHYPATDIPLPARKLFMLNGSRIIQDIYLDNSELHFNPSLSSDFRLNLSYAQLRATSPIHLEYLHNMGVRGTFTLAIIDGEKLWGLFAHHHYSARKLGYQNRKFYEFVSVLFMKNVLRINNSTRSSAIKTQKARIQEVVHSLLESRTLDLFEGLNKNHGPLSEIFNASGLAIIEGKKIFTSGEVPDHATLEVIQGKLLESGQTKIYSTRSIKELLTDKNIEIKDSHSAGFLSICITGSEYLFIFWFRKPETEIVQWGGNPEKAVVIEKLENSKGVRLSPRKSFAKWQQEVKGKSHPWEEYELESADWLHSRITQIGLMNAKISIEELNQRLNAMLNNELEQLIYIASHDLQEPLRTITNYIDLIQKEKDEEKLFEAFGKDGEFYLSRINNSASRMKNMISSLLDYSRIGRFLDLEEVDMNILLAEILEDLDRNILEKKARIHVDTLPVIIGNPLELRQVLQNLLSNALKYSKADVPPEITVGVVFKDGKWHFTVSDNGIGIKEKDYEKIFMLFQRLHRKGEYAGSGIGLALVKKIVEAYHGKISVESEPGKGTTILFSLKNKANRLL